MATRAWYHSFDAWGAQCIHRTRTAEEAVTQHLLHYGLLEPVRNHVQAHPYVELPCEAIIGMLDFKTRPERCTSDHTREVDDEIGDWSAKGND